MRIAEILRRKGRDVSSIRSIDTIEAGIAKLAEGRIGVLVVTDRWNKLAGMFSERDVVRTLAQHGAAALGYEVHEVMTAEVTTCALSDRIDAAMEIMTAHRIRHLPVMEGDRIVGLVSIGDLVNYRLGEKEEEAKVLLDITRAHV